MRRERLSEKGLLIGIDRDQDALDADIKEAEARMNEIVRIDEAPMVGAAVAAMRAMIDA